MTFWSCDQIIATIETLLTHYYSINIQCIKMLTNTKALNFLVTEIIYNRKVFLLKKVCIKDGKNQQVFFKNI